MKRPRRSIQSLQAEGYSVRLAEPGDFQGIYNINTNVYWGLDYLPHYYQQFLKQSNRVCAVCVKQEQIVCFVILHLIDNGETILSEAGRTHTLHEGKSLPYFTGDYIRRIIKENWPKVKLMKNVKRETLETLAKLEEDPFVRILLRTHYVSYQVTTETLSNLLHTNRIPNCPAADQIGNILPLTMDETKDVLQNGTHWEHLFPTGTVIVNWECFNVTKLDNIGEIIERISTCFIMKSQQNNNRIQSLSFGTQYSTKYGDVYDIDYYGDLDINSLIGQFLSHMIHLERSSKESKVFPAVHFPREIPLEAAKYALDKVLTGFEYGRWGHGGSIASEKDGDLNIPFLPYGSSSL
ncbi:unnamed protein product [Owenia fusiformis]|uniref:Histidine N-acetyltransferase C-terminal domain-containing protein n=1 Tax=Owenia fusiformis TaxID=6347 RepID=A0A8S4NDL8_OWEFU|nr:unnamed protein product [Owenia fusiformis]